MQHIEPTSHTVSLPDPAHAGGTLQVAYYEWGAQQAKTLLCVHGLSRNGRDFDYLASALASHYRVLSIDMPGRGQSPWLDEKKAYNYESYAKLLNHFIKAMGLTHIDWVGTSMGGILGMMLAAFNPGLVGRLVMNDIGAFISGEGLKRIAGYLGHPLHFSTRSEAETFMRTNYTSFGLKEEWQWQHVFKYSIAQRPDGTFSFAYDPAIIDGMREETQNFTVFKDVDLWALWKLVPCPVLLLRGSKSDLFSADTAKAMQTRPLPTAYYEVEGVGHAPALMDDAQIGTVRNWLLSTPESKPSGRLSKLRAWCIRKILKFLVKR